MDPRARSGLLVVSAARLDPLSSPHSPRPNSPPRTAVTSDYLTLAGILSLESESTTYLAVQALVAVGVVSVERRRRRGKSSGAGRDGAGQARRAVVVRVCGRRRVSFQRSQYYICFVRSGRVVVVVVVPSLLSGGAALHVSQRLCDHVDASTAPRSKS